MGLRLQCMALPMWAEELTGLTCLEPGGCTPDGRLNVTSRRSLSGCSSEIAVGFDCFIELLSNWQAC